MKSRTLQQATSGEPIYERHAGLCVDEKLALLLAGPSITGQVVHIASDWLLETRATMTPGGDYLLMFPTNTRERPLGCCHYGASGYEKRNDMVAFRSTDQGKTWQGPTVAFDIEYNQHGFIPFIPKGSKRIYAFGTQPVWGQYVAEHGRTGPKSGSRSRPTVPAPGASHASSSPTPPRRIWRMAGATTSVPTWTCLWTMASSTCSCRTAGSAACTCNCRKANCTSFRRQRI